MVCVLGGSEVKKGERIKRWWNGLRIYDVFLFISPFPHVNPSMKTDPPNSQGIGLGHLIKRATPGPLWWFLRSSDSLHEELELRNGGQMGWELSCEQSIRVHMSRKGSFQGLLKLLRVLFFLKPILQLSVDSNSQSLYYSLIKKLT